jgi:thioredoxin-related protein
MNISQTNKDCGLLPCPKVISETTNGSIGKNKLLFCYKENNCDLCQIIKQKLKLQEKYSEGRDS